MIRECIILAGGLGTRLRSAVPELPKCLAPVAGKPFLHWVLCYLRQQGIERFVFSLGYRHELIVDYLEAEWPALDAHYSIEQEPLGTGGAILLASRQAVEGTVLIVNGDTLFKVDLAGLAAVHTAQQAHCTLALKPMRDFDRYGVVTLDERGRISSFREKQFYAEGLINGGVYALEVKPWLEERMPEKFSFEKDYLETYYSRRPMAGYVQDGYFIDIGIPEDLARASTELANEASC
ncbi:MAG: nucleotidyltransferase family protein [Candidatus Pseudobacter hemicellulosilyticus]|uniref:Nucleotidyltransferase family protein n=1 Tax=Candidatus Pseudobacter hemicellulosilyticus TaxID=3121375 RepID=A0AAJ5WPV7_9BACT|nr:MAG: nucleotidyltransferase family protein [Pseudobacter sp.]